MSTSQAVTTVTRRFSDGEVHVLLGIPAGEKITYANGNMVEVTPSRRAERQHGRTFEMQLTVQSTRAAGEKEISHAL